MTTLLGAVLVGGASRRMGRDKATLRLDDGSLLGRRSVDALVESGLLEVVAVGGPPEVAAALDVRWVSDPVPPVGPVGGVLAALEDAATLGRHGAVVLPCDLPRVTSSDVAALVAASERRHVAVTLASIEGRPQYPIGVWHTEASGALAGALAAGRRDFASSLASCEVALVDVSAAFRDADVPRDLPGGG